MTVPRTHRQHLCTIVPPYLLEVLARSEDDDTAQRARRTMEFDQGLRERRRNSTADIPTRPGGAPAPAPVPAGKGAPQRVINDAHGTETLPGERVRTEEEDPVADATANEAYDGLGDTWALFFEAYQRDSLDGKGLPMLATVHYGQAYDNAFWDGSQMVFGDGDGTIFNRFTLSLDVIGHELTHGVTELTAGLVYSGQSGALNESISDAFGSLVKQKTLGQTADQADWLIGADLLTDAIQGRALRDMLNPGTAYDDPQLGQDPQPASMAGYVVTTDDNGGVHLNSGIPNRAFALAARSIGGEAWVGAGQIWYDVITGDISADCDFATFAGLTITAAAARFGDNTSQQQAVTAAWTEVGVIGPSDAIAGGAAPGDDAGAGDDSHGGDRAEGPTWGAPDRPTPAPSGVAAGEIQLSRTGGFAGIQRERTVRMNDLPDDDARAWSTLLSGDDLRALADRPTRPDAFVYQVRYLRVVVSTREVDPTPDLDLSLPEPGLPGEVRDLFRRTLERGD